MDNDKALELMTQLLWNSLLIAGPVLATALVIGLFISVLQVATQLQEATLSYVPKLLACSVVLVVLGPWLLGRLTGFATTLISTIPELGR